jgi:hypothetical protein
VREATSRDLAFKAWNDSKASDAQLALCIKSLVDAIDVMRAAGSAGINQLGFIMMLESMKSAQAFRRRDTALSSHDGSSQ